ncbi:Mediator of RNA polymerase II transcription subunit [Hyphodiscus hymeniophilus]|uniref:Mediator of RNA polymerase II transcription subunit 4 n=1 Tax=Hyphodiscus hymeniophilus TaxID=353542 RepID=A0A9P6VKT6_9HELO|nr:Mediator of RNA polymerase II transcription subunit [Hyphodiscus hymeniophilus]
MLENMNKLVDARFERVEKALQTLITSISTYNPNPAQATDLLAADAELNQGLEQLSTHQRNHEKILSLRSSSSSLDTQIRETLTLLTDTRRALIDTSSTSFSPTTYPVTYTELLSYAKKISDKTLPPTFREKTEPVHSEMTSSPTKDKSESHTNGTTTPVVATNGNPMVTDGQLGLSNNGTAMEIDSATPSNAGGVAQAQTSQEESTALPLEWQTHLNPQAQIQFLPWPADHDIKRGALATIQLLLDRGEDPATFDPERGAELEEERRLKQEEEDRVQAEQQARLEDERRREMERRMSVSQNAGGERKEEQPKVFQLETFDDEDDSE